MYIAKNSGRTRQTAVALLPQDERPTTCSSSRGLSAGSSNTLVMIQGWGFTPDILEEFIFFPVKENVIVLDLMEILAGSNHLEDSADFLFKKIPAGAHLFGWSLGGLVALQFAIKYPAHVKQLITLGTTPCFLKSIGEIQLNKFIDEFDQEPQEALERFAYFQSDNRKNYQRIKKFLIKANDENKYVLRKGLVWLKESDLTGKMQNVSCNTHWMIGDSDPLVPIGAMEEINNKNIKIDVLAGVGHIYFPISR